MLGTVAMFIGLCFILGLMYASFVSQECLEYSLQTFYEWTLYACNEDSRMFIVLLSAFLGIISLPALIIYQILDYKKFNRGFNIKSIDLLPKAIKVNYTNPKHNFTCSYSQISKFSINIDTVRIKTKYGYRDACGVFTLSFSKRKDCEKITFEFQPLGNVMPTLYKIIDFTREINNFSITFSGQGAIGDIKEKVEKYREYGYKDALGENGASTYLQGGWLFFGTGYFAWLFIVCTTMPSSRSDMALFNILTIPLIVCTIIGLCFDIAIIKDRINDNNFAKTTGGVQKPLDKSALGAAVKIILALVSYSLAYLCLLNNVQ